MSRPLWQLPAKLGINPVILSQLQSTRMCQQLATGRSLKLPGIETAITRNVGRNQATPRDKARRIASNIPKLLVVVVRALRYVVWIGKR